MLRLLLQLVTKGFHGFRLSCILSTIIHYKAIIINLTSITFLLFPSEREGYGSRLFAHGMDDDCSITWSNIKFDEHDLRQVPSINFFSSKGTDRSGPISEALM